MFAKKLVSNKLQKKLLIIIDKIVLKSWAKNVKIEYFDVRLLNFHSILKKVNLENNIYRM